MNYGICKHGNIAVQNLPFHCEGCIRDDERKKVETLLKCFTVTAPKESYAGTFTVKQFMKVLEEKEV